jgi:hypothetical protein
VVRALGDLEEEGRMARLLVSVDDPLGFEVSAPPLLLGSFVRVEIDGTPLVDVAVLDAALLHDGKHVWVMNDSNELEIRAVTVAFRGRDQVFVSSGLSAGERVIRSGLSVPVAGMSLRLTAGGASSDG